MKSKLLTVFVLCLFVFLFLSSSMAFAGSGAKETQKLMPSELLVKFKPGVSELKKADIHHNVGASQQKEFSELRLVHVKLKSTVSIEEAILKFKNHSEVEYAQPNYLRRISLTPRDTDYKSLWGLNNTGQVLGTLDADIDAPEAWGVTTGDSAIVVASIDTGVDYNHPDLAANIWTNQVEASGITGVDDDGNGFMDDLHGIDSFYGDCDPMDIDGHGTHTSGTMGAVGNNRLGVTGVNWTVKIMPLKFIGPDGYGSDLGAIECLEYARMMKDRGVNIVATNNSWGDSTYSQALYDAINAQQNILFIASAGNASESNDGFYDFPSCFDLPNIISVAASGTFDEIVDFSNYGRRSVHVAAPGKDILSTYKGGTYATMSGTSMAAPHVTGLVALLKAKDQTRDWRAIKNLILSGGDTIPTATWKTPNGNTITGKRINAYGSLTRTDGVVFSALRFPYRTQTGVTYTVSALSIKGAAPNGPVTMTTSQQTISMLDNGIAPDKAAGDGIFTGTWTAQGESVITFSSPGGTDSITLSPIAIATISMPSASVDTPYSRTLSATGGEPPYSWSIEAGRLPLGLALNSGTGVISGMATEAGHFSFTVKVTDGIQSTTQALTLDVWADTLFVVDGGMGDGGQGVAVDSEGNMYVGGYTTNTNEDSLLIKYNSSGAEVWRKTFDSGFQDRICDVEVDAAGNIYTTGFSFIAAYGASDKYVTRKLDPSGQVIWTTEYTGLVVSYPEDITLDANGNIFIAGGISKSGYSTYHAVLKYNNNGQLVWEKIDTRTGRAVGVAVDSTGNAYTTGYVFMLNPGTGTYMNACLTSKYDSAGNSLWSQTSFQTSNPTGIAVNSAGEVIVGGNYGTYYTGSTLPDIVLLKYDANGSSVWSKTHDSGWLDYTGEMTIDSDGNFYLTGNNLYYPDGNYQTIKFNSDGAVLWEKTTHVGLRDSGYGVKVRNGIVYVTGMTNNGTEDVPNWDLVTIIYDAIAPTVSSFDIPDTSNSRTVPILNFAATDNRAVTGYMITESATKPGLSGWSSTPPTNYKASASGPITLYAWAKDASGNISTAKFDTVVITVPTITINITKAEYVRRTQTLTVYATSSAGQSYQLNLDGYGPMTWNTKLLRWEIIAANVTTTPTEVTVTGAEDSATSPVRVK